MLSHERLDWVLNFNSHTAQTGTYLGPAAADVGGPVASLYVYTLAYRCWGPSSVCDRPRHFKDYTNQRDEDGWRTQGVWSTLYMLYVYLRFGPFWGFRSVECRWAYGDGLLCKHRYTNTVGQEDSRRALENMESGFSLISESGDLLPKKFSRVNRLRKFTLSGGESKAEKKKGNPDVTRSAAFIHKSASHAVDTTL